jgi:hypothetical protein
MSNKLEIRSRMAELQREFSSLNAEIKEIEAEEKASAARERYKEYLFKVGTYGYKIEPEDKIVDAEDSDREIASRGRSGLIYSGFDGHSEFGYIMLKDRSDYARVVKICRIVNAVEHLADDKVKDKEPYIKILLGEDKE